ncbi:MAG: energy-coupling factor transporter ATPase [Candidatus Hepatoplasma vulgare]|nr:MAG: energy-coupling factor transporter ATPase [Candidatus Hepatoplasma sp.]
MIKLENVSYSIENEKILKNINIEIKKGDYISIVGLNGSGKSQLALLLAGVISNYEGNYFYNNELVKSNYILGKKCGIVFQRPENQFVSSIVKNDIAFGLENLNISQQKMEGKINKILEKLNILKLKEKNVNNLSGGERQLVALASILIMDFDFYIFDEITSMLDEKYFKIVFSIIKKLKEEGKTIIYITHNLKEIRFAEKVFIMKDNTIIESLNKEQLTNDILKKYQLI